MAYPLQNSNSGGAHVSILETFSRFDAHLGASGGFWCGSWVVLGWCWVLCAGSWVSFLRFPLWEFHVKAICFHVRVSFDKTSQLLRRFIGALPGNGRDHIDQRNPRRSLVSYTNSLDRVPEKRRELRGYAVSTGGRHGLRQNSRQEGHWSHTCTVCVSVNA